MPRRNAIDGLVEQLRQTNGFEAGNKGTAVAYDHRAVVAGVDRAAIVLASESSQERMVMGGLTEMTHTLEVWLLIRHSNDLVQARQDADLYCHNIVTRVNANPTLGGSVYDSLVTGSRVEDENLKVGATPYLLEVLTVRATEHLEMA